MQKEELTSYIIMGLSIKAIAERTGRPCSTVSYWLARYGLVANGAAKYGPKPSISRQEVRELVEEGLSVPMIALRLGTTPSRVRRCLKRYGLSTQRSRNQAAAREAASRGERKTVLACQRHGECDHLLEGRGSYRCMRCRAERVSEHRRRLKRVLIAEAGGRCRVCGYDRCEAALQFHHLDPSQKSFHLSLRGVTRSLAKLREEARKCVLLCATCHAEVEAGVTTLPAGNEATPRGGLEPP